MMLEGCMNGPDDRSVSQSQRCILSCSTSPNTGFGLAVKGDVWTFVLIPPDQYDTTLIHV